MEETSANEKSQQETSASKKTPVYRKRFNQKTSNVGVKEKFDKIFQHQKESTRTSTSERIPRAFSHKIVTQRSEELQCKLLQRLWQREEEALENRFWANCSSTHYSQQTTHKGRGLD